MKQKIGFGGGCHWCTEAVFEHLKGVKSVLQGWIDSPKAKSFSEAVIVHFDADVISLDILVEIHLRTHSSQSAHSMRGKYRSAIYTFHPLQTKEVQEILTCKASLFEKKLVTQVYPFGSFLQNKEEYLHYYQKHAGKPFCSRHIDPKLSLLLQEYKEFYKN